MRRMLGRNNKEHRVNERDYNRLLARFDLSKAKEIEDGSAFIIVEPCLCHWYNCPHCPLYSCSGILAVNDLTPEHCHFADEEVYWYKQYDAESRAEVQAVRDYLLSLPRMKREER